MDGLEAELEHHRRLKRKATQGYLRDKRGFWDSAMALLGEVRGPVLEVGNGPFGFFLSLEDRKDVFCLDPLNDDYLKLFPHMSGMGNVRFLSGSIDSPPDLPRFRTVLSYNALDHMDDPGSALRRMLSLSTEDAVFLIGVDYYGSRILRWIMHSFRGVIDRPHPNHFTLGDLKELFGRHFVIERIADESGLKTFDDELCNPAGGNLLDHAYFLVYSVFRRVGLTKSYRLGIKRTAVFIMRKRQGSR